MRVILFFVLFLLIILGAVYFFNASRKEEMARVMEANISKLNQRFAELKEGVSFHYDAMEIEGFFTLPEAHFVNPRISLALPGRTMTLKAESAVMTPESSEFTVFRLSLPPTISATDSFQGKDFTYEVKPFPIPRITFRTPQDELIEQASISNASIKRMYRGTNPEQLQQLPKEIIHQISIAWPAILTLNVKYGPRDGVLQYKMQSIPFGRVWQRVHYYQRNNIVWVFGQFAKAIHDAPAK